MCLHAPPYLCNGGHITSQSCRHPCSSQHAHTTLVLLLFSLFLLSSAFFFAPPSLHRKINAFVHIDNRAKLRCWAVLCRFCLCVFVDLNYDQLPVSATVNMIFYIRVLLMSLCTFFQLIIQLDALRQQFIRT
jgi:hypothetical protein